jgi:anti-anti-sigma regulatory factor
MQQVATEGAESLVIRMDGAFDLESARAIRSRLAELADGSEVYVDLSRVREFHDRAVAVLAEGLATARHRVSVRGLRHHQYRMLRYLGVPSSALDPGLAPRAPAYRGDR